MKLTFFTLVIFTLFVGTCTADSYQNGFITGMMIEKVSPTKKAKPIKYNTVIIDTSLFDFPAQKSPVCRPILVRERKYKELIFGDKCVFAIIAILIWYSPEAGLLSRLSRRTRVLDWVYYRGHGRTSFQR